MGRSKKIDCRANGEIDFYWMIPLSSKASKNVLDRGAATESLDEKRGHRNDVEIELETLKR